MQVEFEFPDVAPTTLPKLSSIPFGKPFIFKLGNKSQPLIKVKPVNFLCNSSLLSDVFARGDCVVCNLTKGTVFVSPGTREVELIEASIKVKK